MTPLISIIFYRYTSRMNFLRSTCPLITVMNVLSYPVVNMTCGGASTTSFIVLRRLTIIFKLLRCPLLSSLTLVLSFHASSMPMTINFWIYGITIIRRPQVNGGRGILRPMFLSGFHSGEGRHVAFMLIALISTVNGQVATYTCRRARGCLKLTVAPFFQRTYLARFVLVVHFGVRYHSVVRRCASVSTGGLLYIHSTSVLRSIILAVARFIRVAVSFEGTSVLVRVILRVLRNNYLTYEVKRTNLGRLTGRLIVCLIRASLIGRPIGGLVHAVSKSIYSTKRRLFYARGLNVAFNLVLAGRIWA